MSILLKVNLSATLYAITNPSASLFCFYTPPWKEWSSCKIEWGNENFKKAKKKKKEYFLTCKAKMRES